MINGIDTLYHLKGSNPQKALDKVCKEFESFFAYQLLKVMGDSIPDGGLFEKSVASDMYRDMLFQNVSEAVGETGALGISKVLKNNVKALKALQENSGAAGQSR
jgi:Rod binding domain-containing protein